MHLVTPSASFVRKAVAGTVAALALLPATALADPGPLAAPAGLPGVAALPGPIAPAAKAAATMQVVRANPDIAPVGTAFTLTSSGLPAGRDAQILWSSANVSWILDARPDSVDYIGRKVDKFNVVIGVGKTDATGNLSVPLKVPRDFGGMHDLFVVVDGVQVAKGGFLVPRRMTLSPKSGPIGTPIKVRVDGLGSPLYDSGGAIYWDNKYLGVYTANWTRGEAEFTIRAAGPVGRHQLVSGPAITVDYLNPQQSPQPWQEIINLPFTVTKDAGAPKPTVDWPANVAPTINATTTFTPLADATASAAKATLSSNAGSILSRVELAATGLVPGQKVDILWGNVVGNRVNCTGQCWSIVTGPLMDAVAAADGSLRTAIQIPDTLGGWHAIQLSQGGQVKAQVPYFVTRNVVSVPKRVKAGSKFTIRLKGVGWTQLDNTVAVTYDNSYVGYGCGFNSNGDVELNLVATGGPGTHIVDLWPLLYTQNPPYLNAVYGMVPFLSFGRDAPGLAAGYKIPALRVAITVVK
jgi:hypothetical protein